MIRGVKFHGRASAEFFQHHFYYGYVAAFEASVLSYELIVTHIGTDPGFIVEGAPQRDKHAPDHGATSTPAPLAAQKEHEDDTRGMSSSLIAGVTKTGLSGIPVVMMP